MISSFTLTSRVKQQQQQQQHNKGTGEKFGELSGVTCRDGVERTRATSLAVVSGATLRTCQLCLAAILHFRIYENSQREKENILVFYIFVCHHYCLVSTFAASFNITCLFASSRYHVASEFSPLSTDCTRSWFQHFEKILE